MSVNVNVSEGARDEATRLIARYPLAEAIPVDRLAAEIEAIEQLDRAPVGRRWLGYLRLTGPAFIGSALTLGAGTLTSTMLMGANFGYRTLWIVWLSVALGSFMMAAAVRFSCKGGFRLIPMQRRHHGAFVAVVLTAVIGCTSVAIIFNFGQYSLATHLLESLVGLAGIDFPRSVNWILLLPLTSWLTLLYGRKAQQGVARVELFMKSCVLLMLVGFGITLAVVGVNWTELARGALIPWLPRGAEGVTIFIASSAAAIGVMDWVMLHYSTLSRGWGRKHETLARFDIAVGFFLPFVLVNGLVLVVFAQTLHQTQTRPETAQELAGALAPALGGYWSQVLFYLGLLAVPITTTVGMSIAGTIALHDALGWNPDPESLRWKIVALLPQIGFLAVWYPRPLWLIIIIGAFLSLTQNIVAWSVYLLMNDRAVLGEDRCKSVAWNFGMVANITLVNCVAIMYVLSQLGLWPE